MLLGEAKAPEGTRLYAIGDIHGCIDQLRNMFDAIDRDLEQNPINDHRIILLGDYVDRGPQSNAVLQFIVTNRKIRPLICLLGNHDQRMLDFMEVPHEVGESFLIYGGRELLASYGVDPLQTDDLALLARAFRRNVPQSHIRFLESLAVSHDDGDYFFCHAGIKPGIPLWEQEPDDLIWIRNDFLNYREPHPKVIIHGHTPQDAIDIRPNRINVDSCCFDTGILSCIVLEGNSHKVLTATA